MNLEKYLVIAGVPGVHRLVASRNNGLLIDDLKEKRRRFVPVRNQQITPLATIGIYVESEQETVALGEVFQKMLDAYETTPPAPMEAKSDVFRAYFTAILPDHDQDRVHINDIKKCIRWFMFMRENGIFDEIRAEEAANPAQETTAPDAPPQSDTAPTEPEATA